MIGFGLVSFWVDDFVSWWVCEFISWWVCEFISFWVDEFLSLSFDELLYLEVVGLSRVYKPVNWFVLHLVFGRSVYPMLASQRQETLFNLLKVQKSRLFHCVHNVCIAVEWLFMLPHFLSFQNNCHISQAEKLVVSFYFSTKQAPSFVK